MHITVDKTALVRELALHNAIAAKGGQIPILSNVSIGATVGEPTLNLEATDLEIAIRSQCVANVKATGSVTIPAKRLLDYVSKLPDGDVEIKQGANNWLSITAGRAKSRMAGMDASAWPELPTLPDAYSVQLSAAMFARMVRQTAYAISMEESRFTLNGALIEVADGKLRMVATDGHRLALAEATQHGEPLKVLMPRKALLESAKLAASAPGGAIAKLTVQGDRIYFAVDDRSIASRMMTGTFPDYKRIMPDHKSVLTVDRVALLAALERVVGFSDERSRAIRVEVSDAITIKATTADIGDSEETVDATVSGDPLQVGLNATYMIEALKSVDVDKIELRWKDGGSALDVRPVGGMLDGRCVIMPMRV